MIREIRFGMAGLLLVTALSLSCSGGKSTGGNNDQSGPSDLPGGVESDVVADSGAVLTTGDGIILSIGPNALPTDTLVKLVPIDPPTLDNQFIAGARLEPEGLVLDAPVHVRFPLPSNWSSSDNPLVFEFNGDDPALAVATMAYARITGGGDTLFAEVLVSHFSGIVCAKNCHAGTIRAVLDQFEARGCNRDSLLAEVRRHYPGISVPQDGCGQRGAETVQAFLDTYFDDIASYNADEETPTAMLTQLYQYILQGRQVVLAFKAGTWGVRSGEHDFFPTGAMDFAHTAPLQLRNGQIQIRNTLSTENSDLIGMLGGNNVAWYPAAELNAFRQLPAGVAVELQACGTPDCLSDPSRNNRQIAPFQPIDGRGFVGQAWSDPWTYLLGRGPWHGVPPRGIPWSAVRIYLEKVDGPQNIICAGPQGNSLTASLDIPGRIGFFQPASVLAGFGERDDLTGLPAIAATTDITPDPSSPRFYDFLGLVLGRNLESQGDYDFSDGSAPSFAATMWFSTPLIKDEDTDDPTTFLSTSGTLQLGSYGIEVGSRVSGSFTVNVHGEQAIQDGADFQYVPIDGTIEGSFDVVLSDTEPPVASFKLGSFKIKRR